jgi:hypothetical protein
MIILLGLSLIVMITTALACWVMLIIYGFKVLKEKTFDIMVK